MSVLAALLGPQFPNWTFVFAPTLAEVEEARRVFGEPRGVVFTCQLQVHRGADGDGYVGRAATCDGPRSGATLTELAAKFPSWARRDGGAGA